jgi:hypothetical protein
MRLVVVVEGQTEEAFVNEALAPHLWIHDVFASATIVGTPRRRGSAPLTKGGGDWRRWERDIRRVLGQRSAAGLRVTTLLDLYGLPSGFPGLAEHGTDPDTDRRCDSLEATLGEAINDPRFIPYLQRHEFEALVLASLGPLRALLDAGDDRAGLDVLAEQIADLAPEDVDDGRETAPSKRLLHLVPGYAKTVHGPLALAGAGLPALRAKCPRFDAWLMRLEDLGGACAMSAP